MAHFRILARLGSLLGFLLLGARIDARAAAVAKRNQAPSDLVFGILGSSDYITKTAADSLGLPHVVPLTDESERDKVDVVVRLTHVMGTWIAHIQIETYAAGDSERLTEGRARWTSTSGFLEDIREHLNSNFARGTPLYASIVAKRKPAEAANAPASMSTDQIAQIVKQTIADTAKPPPDRPQPHSEADTPRYKAAERPDDYAIVIGIEKYSDLPSAEYAEHDASAIRDHFAALGIPERHIVSLIGAKAGKAAFTKTFETWLPANVNAESTVWVYYSGHGAPDPRTGQAFLLPWDGDPQFLDDTGYPLKRLYSKLNSLPASRVVVMLDSCFSGAGGRSVLAKGVRPLVTKIDAGMLGRNIVALTASAADEISGTSESEEHGLFTYQLLRGLNGDAADGRGRVTLKSLFDYVAPKVEDGARRQNREQKPQLLPGPDIAASVLLH